MRKSYALIVFLLLTGYGKAQTYALTPTSRSMFGFAAPFERKGDPAPERTVSVARLRHKLVGNAVATFARAAKFVNAGAWQKSVLELQKAVTIDPEFSEAHGNLGANYMRLGRFDDAASELRSAIRLDPATGAYHANLALAMTFMGRPGEAELEARSAVAIDAANFKANYILGILLARRPEARAAAIPHLIYAARSLPEGHMALAELYLANGDTELARTEMERYRAAQSKPARER